MKKSSKEIKMKKKEMKKPISLHSKKKMKRMKIQKTNWGIGIEHELRIRFEKNIRDFPSDFSEHFFPKTMKSTLYDSSGYLFINSYILQYYFQMMKVPIGKFYFEYAKTEEEKEFAQELVILYDLFRKAKAKELYPLDHPLYFQRSSEKSKVKKNIERVKFFISIYSLYHHPLLFYHIIHRQNSQNNILLEDMWDYEYQIEHIMEKSIFDQFITDFTSYYNGDFYKTAKERLQDILTNYPIHEVMMDFVMDDEGIRQNLYLSENNDHDDLFDPNIKKKIEYQDVLDIQKKYIHVLRKIMDEKIDFEFQNDEDQKQFYLSACDMFRYHIPVPDHSQKTTVIEFTTVHYKNNAFEDQYHELMNFENTFFRVINHLPPFKKFVDILGPVSYHQSGSIGETIEIFDILTFDYHVIEPDYTGSYHVWVTPPYHPKTSPERFMQECSSLANKYQLLEPLIASHFTSPSEEAFGDDGKMARTSLRQFVGAYSNYGTSDISFLHGAPSHQISKYYVNEEDLKSAVKEGKQNAIYAFVETPVYRMNGKQVMNFDKLEERILTSDIYKNYKKGDINSHPPPSLRDYYSVLFDKSKIRPIDNYLQIGPDIRTRSFTKMIEPLSNDWIREYFKKDNKFIEVYVNYNTKQISYTPIFHKEKYEKLMKEQRIGIELRIFDHFPTHQLQQVLSIFAGLTYQSYDKPYNVSQENMYIHQQWWHDEMANVIIKGFEFKPSYTYLKNISKELGLSEIRMPKSLKEDQTYSQITMETIYRRLDLKYKNEKLYQALCFFQKPKSFQSINRRSWFFIFTNFLLKNPNVYKELKEKKGIKREDVMKILGPKYEQNVQRIQQYLK